MPGSLHTGLKEKKREREADVNDRLKSDTRPKIRQTKEKKNRPNSGFTDFSDVIRHTGINISVVDCRKGQWAGLMCKISHPILHVPSQARKTTFRNFSFKILSGQALVPV